SLVPPVPPARRHLRGLRPLRCVLLSRAGRQSSGPAPHPHLLARKAERARRGSRLNGDGFVLFPCLPTIPRRTSRPAFFCAFRVFACFVVLPSLPSSRGPWRPWRSWRFVLPAFRGEKRPGDPHLRIARPNSRHSPLPAFFTRTGNGGRFSGGGAFF